MGWLFGKKKEPFDPGEVRRFYTDCIADFHEEAKKYNVATKGVIFIPELDPIGQKVVLEFLKDPFFHREFAKDAEKYYYFIMAMAIDAGIVIASKWEKDFDGLGKYVNEMLEAGPADDANQLLKEYFPDEVSQNQGNTFFNKIFLRWLKMHEPYWKMRDPRQFTFHAVLAAYQVGVSMMLEKYGYGDDV